MLRNPFSTRHWRGFVIITFAVIILSLSLFQTEDVTSTPIESAGFKSRIAEMRLGQASAQTMQTYKIFLPSVLRQREFPPFGVQVYFDIANTQVGLQRMIDLQTVWVRRPVNWNQIEPTDTAPEYYHWAVYDSQFLEASANGLNIVATISNNPAWAAETGGGPVYPEHMDDLLEFVSAVVERYDGDGQNDAPGSPKVLHWEFYNEPDNGSLYAADRGFGYWGDRGDEYANLMAQVYPLIKAANPSASILMGGIAYDNFSDEGLGVFRREFIDDFLAAGGGNYIDFLNFHYYPAFAYKWNAYGPGLIGKTNFLTDKLASYGITNKPVAITEIGITTDPNLGGSNELQSRYVVQAYSRAGAADIKIMIWFTLNDLSPQYIFGLTDIDFVSKPSYTAYQTVVTQLGNAAYQRSLSTAELGYAQAEGYVYQRGQETLYVVWTNDDSLTQMTIQASQVTKVDKFGASVTIFDTTDGVADGLVIVNYDGSPVYLISGSKS